MSDNSIFLSSAEKRVGKQNLPLIFLKFIHGSTPPYLKAPLGRFLAYEWERRQGDKQFLAILKSIGNALLVYFPLLCVLRFIQRICSEEPLYPIEYEIVLTTTRVLFTRSKRTLQHICLKIWQRSDDEVCNDKLVIRSEDYLLEGLAFNRKFAQNVYFGVAPVILSEDTQKIQRGRLIKMPEKSNLEPGVKYALVMRCLNKYWRLDEQLRQSRLSSRINIKFLAKEVARMHRQLEHSPDEFGTPERILAKLELNRELFLEALDKLSHKQIKVVKYASISESIAKAGKAYTELFRQRQREGHIKRCHGDLKATNLWVRPAKTLFLGLKYSPQQLLALDCIDFNPEFCHIDTLSDVAMLAIDIEMLSMNWVDGHRNIEYEQRIANYFLDCYLREIMEDSIDVWPLLRYYMTEKAMVCAYVSILYDNQPGLGQTYLDIAYVHAKQLENPVLFLPAKILSPV